MEAPSGKKERTSWFISASCDSSWKPKILEVELSTIWIANSQSIRVILWRELKSKRSKRKSNLSSAFASANMTSPANNSKAFTLPLLAVSHIAKVSEESSKIFSNYVKLRAKSAQTLLKEAWNSRTLARESPRSGQLVVISFKACTKERKEPIY